MSSSEQRGHMMNQGLGTWVEQLSGAPTVFTPSLSKMAGLLLELDGLAELDESQTAQRRSLKRNMSEIHATLARLPRMREQILEDKIATLTMLEELKVPCFAWRVCTTDDFHKAPRDFYKQIPSSIYYLTLFPADSSAPRGKRIAGQGESETTAFFESIVAGQEGFGRLLLMETARMHYGFNITIGDGEENPILVEAVQGTHSDLVGMQQPIVMTMQREGLPRRFLKFTTMEPEIYYSDADYEAGQVPPKGQRPRVTLSASEELGVRRGITQALLSIPHTIGDDHSPEYWLRDARFHPGYYEGALLKAYSPVFIEYSNQPPFQPANF